MSEVKCQICFKDHHWKECPRFEKIKPVIKKHLDEKHPLFGKTMSGPGGDDGTT